MILFDRMRAIWQPPSGRHAAGAPRPPTAPEVHRALEVLRALSTPAPPPVRPLVCGDGLDGVRAELTPWVRAWLTQHQREGVPA